MATVADVIAAAPSFSGPDWKERERGRSSARTTTAEQTYWVQRGQLGAALAAIHPGTDTTITIGSATITRKVPLRHPDFPNLYADGYDYEVFRSGEGPVPGQWCSGPMVKVRVFYRAPEYPYDGDEPYQRVSARGFQHDIPCDNVLFEGTAETPSYSVNRWAPGASYRFSVFEAPGITPAIEADWTHYAGSVNADTFRGIAPGHILYHSPEFDYVMKRDGSKVCNYSLTFDTLPFEWNKAYRRDGTLAYLNVGGARPYAAIDFNTLFK